MSPVEQDSDVSLKEIVRAIREWFKYILSNWKIVVLAAALGAACGLVYALMEKPMYRADLSFALEEASSGGGIGGALGLASQLGFDLGGSGGGAFAGDNLQELMKSRSMVELALLKPVKIKGKEVTLADLYIDITGKREAWKKNEDLKNLHFLPGENRENFPRVKDSLLGVFHKSIVNGGVLSLEKIDKKLSIVIVKVTSENEIFSKYFAENLVDNVSEFYINTRTKKTAENLRILQHQTDSVRRALNGALMGVASSSDNNPNPNAAMQVLRVPSQRRLVDVQANQAILTELVKNLEVSKVTLRKETPLIQIIDRPVFPLVRTMTGKKKALAIGMFSLVTLTVGFLTVRRAIKNMDLNH